MKFIDDANDDQLSNMYLHKIKDMKEIKLREFNFKIIHGILPCNLNLFRWKIKDSNFCDVCQEIQSIEHLLFECQYVKPLWDKVNNTFSTKVNYKVILGLDGTCDIDLIVTMICYFIYKEWLLVSLEDKCRNEYIDFNFYKGELNLRLQIFKQCKRFHLEELNLIESLLSDL